MKLIKTLTVQLLEDRGFLKARVNMVDEQGQLARGMLVPIARLK